MASRRAPSSAIRLRKSPTDRRDCGVQPISAWARARGKARYCDWLPLRMVSDHCGPSIPRMSLSVELGMTLAGSQS